MTKERKALSVLLTLTLIVQYLGVIPTMAQGKKEQVPGVWMEYFTDYDRRTDYSTSPYVPMPGNDEKIAQGTLMGHAGIPEEMPVTWSQVATQINEHWTSGDEQGINGPDQVYENEHLVGTDYFAIRWTADLTTPDYTGDYYFKVNANDGKTFKIYEEGKLLGSYIRWDASAGAVNTGTPVSNQSAILSETDSCQGFTKIDAQGDVIKIGLKANTTYRIEMAICEHKHTAFGKLAWLYGEDENDGTALYKLGGSDTTGLAHEDYLVPAACLTLPTTHVGNLVQGYVYDAEGQPLAEAEVTVGAVTVVTEENGYYRLMTPEEGRHTLRIEAPGHEPSEQIIRITRDTSVSATHMVKGKNRYTVTFDTDGGTPIPAQQVVENENIILPQNPYKAGYTFAYWFVAGDEAEKPYDGKLPVTSPLCLKAKWQEVPLYQQGLVVRYYNAHSHGTDLALSSPTVERFLLNSPIKSTWETAQSLVPDYNWSEGYAVSYEGKLRVDEPGLYQFRVEVNDSFLWKMDGQVIADTGTMVVEADEVVPYEYSVEMTAGYHDLYLLVANKTGAGTINLKWKKPGDEKYVTVPRNLFFTDKKDSHVILSGVVKDGETPVVGATVSLYYMGSEARQEKLHTATTGQDGKYEILVKKDTYDSLTISKEGYTVDVLKNGEDFQVTEAYEANGIIKPHTTGTLKIEVIGPEQGTFTLVQEEKGEVVHSGNFIQGERLEIVDLTAGQYTLTLQADEYETYTRELFVTVGAVTNISATMKEKASVEETLIAITGTISGPDGKGVKDAIITFTQKGVPQLAVKTNGKGDYTAQILAGEYLLKITRQGYQTQQQPIVITGGEILQLPDYRLEYETSESTIPVQITVRSSVGNQYLLRDTKVILDGQEAITSKQDGKAYFSVKEAGTYPLIIARQGYQPIEKIITISADTCYEETVFLQPKLQQWQPYDINFTKKIPTVNGKTSNPYMDTPGKIVATFTNGKEVIEAQAFYRDNGKWTVRFTPNAPGEWHYTLRYDGENDIYFGTPIASEITSYMNASSGNRYLELHPGDVTTSEIEDFGAPYNEAYEALFEGLTGSVTVVKNDNEKMHGGIKRDPNNKQHFVYEDGTDYYLFGYEIDWVALLDQGDDGIEKAKKVIDIAAEGGFTEILMNTFGWDSTWAPGDYTLNSDYAGYDFGPTDVLPWKYDGHLSANDYDRSKIDFSQMNEAYWAKFDEVIAYINARGMTAHIFWKVLNKFIEWPNTPHKTNIFNRNWGKKIYVTPTDTMFARYFVARYAPYNVILDVGKEAYNFGKNKDVYVEDVYTDSEKPAGESQYFYLDMMLREFRKANTYDRIVTIHDFDMYYDYLLDHKDNPKEKNGEYEEMVQLYTDQDHPFAAVTQEEKFGYSPYGTAMEMKHKFPEIPYYNSETNYQWANNGHYKTFANAAEQQSPEGIIVDYCDLAMAGAYAAHYYGNHAWDVVKYDETPDHMAYYKNLTTLITEIVGLDIWKKMIPDDAVIGGKTGMIPGAVSAPGEPIYYNEQGKHAMAMTGSHYLVYLGYGSDEKGMTRPEKLDQVTVHFEGLTEPLEGIWYNVLTGEKVRAGRIEQDGKVTFDWPSHTTLFDRSVLETSGVEKHGSGESIFLYFSPVS